MDLIERALETAAAAHQDQVRKGTSVPYIAHPAAVGIMLARAGCRDEVVAAGILHDTVEDTALTLEDIREQFGADVADLVDGCTEPPKSQPWEVRKKHTMEHLPSASWEVKSIICADKLHNVRSIIAAQEIEGPSVWNRFRRGKSEQEWYYRNMVAQLCDAREGERPVLFCRELREAVDTLFGAQS